jgi:hypothetical protein
MIYYLPLLKDLLPTAIYPPKVDFHPLKEVCFYQPKDLFLPHKGTSNPLKRQLDFFKGLLHLSISNPSESNSILSFKWPMGTSPHFPVTPPNGCPLENVVMSFLVI